METEGRRIDSAQGSSSGSTAHIPRNWRNIQKPIRYLVKANNGTHAGLNPGYICYSGDEKLARDLQDSEVRAKALDALDDMGELFAEDFPNLSPKNFMPSSMGCQVIKLAEPEQGWQIFYHSSMRRKEPPLVLELAERFKYLYVEEGEESLVHRRTYQCAEPGLLTNSDTAYPGSSRGSRLYIVDRDGQFLPPCGSDLGGDTNQIGCHHIVAKAEAVAIQDGWATNISRDTITYIWYNPTQIRPSVQCKLSKHKASKMASRIASEVIAEKSIEMGATSTLQTTPSTNPLMGQELQSYIRKSARIMVTTISSEIHRRLSRIANRLPFEEAYTAVSEAMTKAESVLAGSERFAAKLSRKADAAEKNAARAATTESPKKATSENAKRLADIAKGAREKATEADDLAKAWKMALQVDDRGNYNIRSKVIAKVTSWAVDRLATKPVIRSMGFISYSTDEHPARTLTMEQLKRYTAAKEPTDFLKRMEIENRQAAEGSAFAEFLKRNEMDGLE